MRNQEPVTQKQKLDRVERFVREHQQQLARQGAVVASWRQYQGRRLGPYYRLVFRDAGRQQTLYLGTDPELAARIRRWLAELQTPARDRRRLRQQYQIMRRGLVRCRAQWQRELNRIGLGLRGSHVCGWRLRRPGRRRIALGAVASEHVLRDTPQAAATTGHDDCVRELKVQDSNATDE